MWHKLFAAAMCVLLTVPATALDGAQPDASRQAATAFLDAIATAKLTDREKVIAALHSRSDAERRQAVVRKRILELIGDLPDRSAPLNAHVTGTHQSDGFRVENVVFDSLPGYRITANVFVPAGHGRFPAIILSPGHSPAGKMGDYGFAANFARAGILALTYDIVGEGERWQHYDPEINASKLERPTAEHSLIAYQTMLLGGAVARYFINDTMRGIDYLVSRADVDTGRIGAYGCSGGGTMTAFATALDPRIKAAAAACFVTNMRHLLASVGPQEGEQSIPGFTAAGFDLSDWVELAAPRPYAIVSTTEDMFPFEGAREAYTEAKRFWGLYGAGDKLYWITGPGRHGALTPVAADIVGFFTTNLKNEATKPQFLPLRPARPEDVLVTASGQLSTSLGSETVQSLMKARAELLAAKPAAQSDHLVRNIRTITGAQAQPGGTAPASRILKNEMRDGYRLATVAFTPSQGLAFNGVLATPDGAIKGRMIYLDRTPPDQQSSIGGTLEAFAKSGWQVLALVPAGGRGEEIKASILGDYTLFALRAMLVGRTITGLRIDETIAAADWLSRQPGPSGGIAIYGVGTLGPTALHAAVLDRRFTHIILKDVQTTYRMSVDQPISRDLPEIALPGVLRQYDLPDLMAAVSPRTVLAINPTDSVGRSLRQDEFATTIHIPGNPDRVQWLTEAPHGLPFE
jgi:dienelactone hydrolase